MSLSIYIHRYQNQSRLFFSRSLSSHEIRSYVFTQNSPLHGASIRVHSSFWGPLLSLVGLCHKWTTAQGTYYLNTSSLKKFVYRLFMIHPSHHDVLNRIKMPGEHICLPLSPLSLFSDTRSHFTERARGLMQSLHNHYMIFKSQGYNSEVLKELNISYIMLTLGWD